MPKYIIKNCPAYSKEFCTTDKTDDIYCKDCEYCFIKQFINKLDIQEVN